MSSGRRSVRRDDALEQRLRGCRGAERGERLREAVGAEELAADPGLDDSIGEEAHGGAGRQLQNRLRVPVGSPTPIGGAAPLSTVASGSSAMTSGGGWPAQA